MNVLTNDTYTTNGQQTRAVMKEIRDSLTNAQRLDGQETRQVLREIRDVIAKGQPGGTVYGFHIDSTESDPSAAVTYLADAAGMTPARMDFTSGRFLWGSWENAFFLPRPCMLKSNGRVDYYLDENDYTKKSGSSESSDISNTAYGGNAMMEWGRDGKKIWYKIVPDTADTTSASVYIADYRVDEGYRAWSFVNSRGSYTEHFYTPIYNGWLDSGGKLRSLSGQSASDLLKGKTVSQEVAAAELNNLGADKLWYTEVYADVTLVNLLLILMAKTLNTQGAYGNGKTADTIGTGTMDTKGMFWGSSSDGYGVKVFGMENWWGNIWRRYAGHMTVDRVHMTKLTRGRQDGSSADDYNATAEGYLTGAAMNSDGGFAKTMTFDENGRRRLCSLLV